MDTISVCTSNRVEFVEITGQVRRWLREQGVAVCVLTRVPEVSRQHGANSFLALHRIG